MHNAHTNADTNMCHAETGINMHMCVHNAHTNTDTNTCTDTHANTGINMHMCMHKACKNNAVHATHTTTVEPLNVDTLKSRHPV